MKRVIIILILLAGIAMMFYPFLSNFFESRNGSYIAQNLTQEMVKTDVQSLATERARAQAYNASLTGEGIVDPFVPDSGIVIPENYSSILDFSNHAMGSLEIPKINVNLPIYHGVSEQVLSKGVGHMSETAFPIGGANTHAVLTGHTGLAKAKIFTDLTKLIIGDLFFIHILGETEAYQIDQILVTVPEETAPLRPDTDKDLVTLLTCTPYGINSHRLLVRGIRTDYTPDLYNQAQSQNKGKNTSFLLLALIPLGSLAFLISWKKYRKKKRY